MATTLTQAEFERQFGADTIRRFFTDDGANQANPGLVMHTLERADARAIGLLMKGGTEPWARKLLEADIAARGYAYDLAAAMMGARRPEFMSDGNLYADAANRAEKALKDMGDATTRAKGETEAGANAHVGLTVKPSPTPRVFRYADGRPKGGF
jgi:hypothetical protein